MKESEFSRDITSYLAQAFPRYTVKAGINLQHSIIFGDDGEVWPRELSALPGRKLYAYQVDIVVSKGKVPLVGVESQMRTASRVLHS
jgi:hypothetical protein